MSKALILRCLYLLVAFNQSQSASPRTHAFGPFPFALLWPFIPFNVVYSRWGSHGAGEGKPIVGHSLGKGEESGGEVLGVLEGDTEFARREVDASRQVGEAQGSGRCRNPHAAARELAAGALEVVGEAGAAGDFPLEAVALGGALEARQEGLAFGGEGVAGLEARKTGHELAGATFLDAEELLDGEAVEVRNL